MIPRLKAAIGKEELTALFRHPSKAVRNFENLFAETFQSTYAIAFPYGRSALWAFFNAMGIKDAEIVQPAYTCSVVGHATVLSDNQPRFVDINLTDYNMNIDRFADAINERTRAVIPTHLFGYPTDIDCVDKIVKDTEKKYGHKIYSIQDCAHSFDAEWHGKSVIQAGDCALFGLGISKQITSIFGGMLTTNDSQLAKEVSEWRDNHFEPKSWSAEWKRRIYLLAANAAFYPGVYDFTHWLQENTRLLKGLTDAYHLDEAIHFPPDFDKKLSTPEASVGVQQLKKYENFKNARREIADFYFDNLTVPENWVMPPRIEGATYSHFVIRVPDRKDTISRAARRGVQLGQLIEYSMPHLAGYQKYAGQENFPNSSIASRTTINLPIYPGLTESQLKRVVDVILRI